MEYTVDAYLAPDEFYDRWNAGYELERRARMVFLISDREAPFEGFDADRMAEIRSLPSYYAEELAIEPGEQWLPTIDVRSSPGCIFLVHESGDQLARDYEAIRRLESRLYRSPTTESA